MSVIYQVLCIVSNIEADNLSFTSYLVIICPYVLDHRETLLVLLPQLEKHVLKLSLRLHHIEVCLFPSISLYLKEELVIDEIVDWLVIGVEIKVGVYEGYFKLKV